LFLHPVIYPLNMGGVPSIPTNPSRKLQVIGAGYSRTGTVTMQLALEQLLDGPVLHGATQILSREDGEATAPRCLCCPQPQTDSM
jgi:phosphoribosyl-dephospho-CoA transferase